MEELIRQYDKIKDMTSAITTTEVLFALLLTFILSLIVAKIYQITHEGVGYSRSFAHTIIITSVVVAALMVIIGSNIARAFSLVGALSIIRFRTAVKDPKDVAFIFWGMALGMACGTRFYSIGVILTVLVSLIIYTLTKLGFASKTVDQRLCRIRIDEDIDYNSVFKDVFQKYLIKHRLTNVDTVKLGALLELTYIVVFKKDSEDLDFIKSIREINNNNKVQLVSGQEEIDL